MGEHPPARPARRSWLWRVLAATVTLGGVAILCFGLGFLWFAWRVPRQEVVLTAKADNGKVTFTDENGTVATVTIADVIQSNGVIHVIDAVLLPKM